MRNGKENFAVCHDFVIFASDMKTDHLLTLLLFVSLLCSCGNKPQCAVPEGFRAEIMLKSTPVKDQGKSGVSWCHAMLAVIESEHLMQGDSVNLSTDYVMRCWLRQQAEAYFRSKGADDITVTSEGQNVCTLIRRYGCFPYDSYYNPQPVNYNVLVRRIKMLADLAIAKGSTEAECMKSIDDLLDKEMGSLPKNVYMLRAEYTPLEFAHSVCGRGEYVTIGKEGLSMPIDSVYHYVCKSLIDRHPVMWTSDEKTDNAFAIIGMGKDKNNEQYFVAKDTHGMDSQHGGRLYIPDSYLRKHTDFVVIKRDVLQ